MSLLCLAVGNSFTVPYRRCTGTRWPVCRADRGGGDAIRRVAFFAGAALCAAASAAFFAGTSTWRGLWASFSISAEFTAATFMSSAKGSERRGGFDAAGAACVAAGAALKALVPDLADATARARSASSCTGDTPDQPDCYTRPGCFSGR